MPIGLNVKADSPWKTMKDFMAAAKANPGKYSVAVSGVGTHYHAVILVLEQETGVKMRHVPFVASMYIGNIMLLVLNLPLIGLFVQILKTPYTILSPLIIMFVLLGAYTVNNSVIDVFLTGLFGVLGYLLKRYGFEVAPLVLAFVLGPMMETSFRQALVMSPTNSVSIFFTRPISAPIVILSIVVLFLPLILKLFRRISVRGLREAEKL